MVSVGKQQNKKGQDPQSIKPGLSVCLVFDMNKAQGSILYLNHCIFRSLYYNSPTCTLAGTQQLVHHILATLVLFLLLPEVFALAIPSTWKAFPPGLCMADALLSGFNVLSEILSPQLFSTI